MTRQILILDEPMTSLDPISQQDVRELIHQLKETGKTLLISTHNIDEAEKLCDQILILDHGKLLRQGTPQRLMSQLSGKEVINFNTKDQVSYNQLKGSLAWLPSYSAGHKRVATDNGAQHLQELTEVANKRNITLTHLSIRQTSLEDVFFHVTGRSICDQ